MSAISSATAALPSPPALNLYLDPISPSSTLGPKDRFQLVLQSARPWSAFFSPAALTLPTLSELRLRLSTNVETYFYNYFLLALAFTAVFALGHLPSVLALVAVLAVAFFLYVLRPEPVEIGRFEIATSAKHAIVVALALLALTVGHVFSLIVSIALFLIIVVGVHGSLHAAE